MNGRIMDTPGVTTQPRITWRGLLWPAAVCLIWTALAARSPHVTYHLAPVIAGAAGPVAVRMQARSRLSRGSASLIALAGLGITMAAQLGLGSAGWLAGPSLWHGSGALETPMAAGVGAAWGWRVAVRRRRGVLGRLD